jgi:hypothetical protein
MIIVDERDTGEKTPTMIEMDEGWHDIKLIKEGYAWNKRIYVKSGEKNDIEAVLEKKEEVMLLKVESEPSGADVYIDGAYYGKTPLFTKVISVEHKIKIKKELYKTEERVVPVPPDKKALLRVKLERKGIMNFRASWEFSPYHPEDIYEIKLDTIVKVIGPLYVNLGIGRGAYPHYYDDRYVENQGGFHLSLGTEIQYPFLKRNIFGLYHQPISLLGGFKFFEYIRYGRTDHFGVSFYGGVNLLYLYFGLGYRIMTSEECGDGYCDPSGFFLSLGLRFGF